MKQKRVDTWLSNALLLRGRAARGRLLLRAQLLLLRGRRVAERRVCEGHRGRVAERRVCDGHRDMLGGGGAAGRAAQLGGGLPLP